MTDATDTTDTTRRPAVPCGPGSGYGLADRYLRTEGTVFATGIQALARIPIDQLRRDRAAGRSTAAFCSGYPGSPLGGLDHELARAAALVPELPIVHQPAVNEELAATSVMGSQLAPGRPDARYEGVVGLWYGKAPGLDRAGDALRHGVFAGSSARGGAVVVVGDDPACKSSTMPSSSDATLVDLHMPIFYPGNAAECLELGLHAVALSRSTGLWASMKIVTPVADGSGTLTLPALGTEPVVPLTDDGRPYVSHPSALFLGPRMLDVEREFREVRLPLAARYGTVNRLNRITVDPPDAWIGLVATGFTYRELFDALRRLGLGDERSIEDAGIRLLQLRMPVPFDADLVRTFARGLDEIVVVEEKNPTLEWLVKDALYGGSHQPLVVGKADEGGAALMRSWGLLDADAILPGLRRRLDRRLAARLAPEPGPPRHRTLLPLSAARTPYFCSGCPHNWGTKVPDGALVGAGTGCHGMTLLMDPERVGEGIGITAMGNEGAQWIGMEPFVEADHLFQNYGDGTFLHSAQLALQYCIGAGKHMTFKILWNGTVAMTGGQDPTNPLTLTDLAAAVLAYGAAAVAVTTDDPDRHRTGLPAGVTVHHRDEIVAVQQRLRDVPGVTVLIHDQACAAELRRDRKRGRLPAPTRRVVIDHRVCEGCGDCGDVSNCLSVQPFDTPLGRRTRIDQASCNYDESCLGGDCPAFLTVEVPDGTDGPGGGAGDHHEPGGTLPDPPSAADTDHVRIRMAGIGGTGVVTVAQILATAAMFDGWEVGGLDQTGLSQKAGPVISDVVLVRPGAMASNLVGAGQADVLLGFDGLVAAADGALAAADPDHTAVVVSVSPTPTGAMVVRPDQPYPGDEILDRLTAASVGGGSWALDTVALASALVGEPATANVLLLGVAVQAGLVPVDVASLEGAIELNRVAVEANLAAFRWGRRWCVDPAEVEASAAAGTRTAAMTVPPLPPSLGRRIGALAPGDHPDAVRLRAFVEMLTADIVGFGRRGDAAGFLDLVAATAEAERAVDPGSTALVEAVARGRHRLTAYKDEYEVARLLLLPDGRAEAREVGGPGARITWHLHPPLLRSFGLDRKLRLGPWAEPALRALRSGKRLRGTRFDPFGRTELRRIERSLPADYDRAIDRLLGSLGADNLAAAVAIAGLPDRVRGYEELKRRRIDKYRHELARDLDAFVADAATS
ncbi:MAG: indolepyruvate ferredoxin oxidoreductase family protein [Acidimicrobiales bacterium]